MRAIAYKLSGAFVVAALWVAGASAAGGQQYSNPHMNSQNNQVHRNDYSKMGHSNNGYQKPVNHSNYQPVNNYKPVNKYQPVNNYKPANNYRPVSNYRPVQNNYSHNNGYNNNNNYRKPVVYQTSYSNNNRNNNYRTVAYKSNCNPSCQPIKYPQNNCCNSYCNNNGHRQINNRY